MMRRYRRHTAEIGLIIFHKWTTGRREINVKVCINYRGDEDERGKNGLHGGRDNRVCCRELQKSSTFYTYDLLMTLTLAHH
jgi:hypothetical protein